MKKILKKLFSSIIFVFVLVLVVCLIFMPINVLIKDVKGEYNASAKSYSESLVYAKVKDNCHLFKSSDVSDCSYRNVIFIIPSSYFVNILQEVNSFIYRVQYKNKIGYVSADSVIKVNFIPSNIFLEDVTFDISEVVGTQIRSSPAADSLDNVLAVIPAGSDNLNYIARIEGEIPTGGSSKYWYYSTYSPESDPTSVYEGYVYSEKTINLTNITPNTENADDAVVETDKGNNGINLTLNNTIKIILIVLICIPIILVFILMVVSNRKSKEVDEFSAEEDINFQRNSKVKERKFKSVDQLRGVKLHKKSLYDKFITTESESKVDSSKPNFPSYEIIDDDDLL